MYNLGYSATANYNSLSKKVFNTIIDRQWVTDEMLFIPDCSRSKKELKKIYNNLSDMRLVTTREGKLQQYNDMNGQIENYYENMMLRIVKSKCVITPSNFWTMFCNIHHIPVFSWGDNISMYKTVYRFDNEQFKAIPFARGSDINIIIESIEKFIKEIE